ncbi:hypothetical protein [Streptomyces sp. NPDC005262]|uniref:hypothetical protein n=1 Tax=Streptomyces sp. NPDC005262 TaxID=3364710 RepID=UPI00368962A0
MITADPPRPWRGGGVGEACAGTFTWWGNITYSRADVPGPTADTGWSLKFFE